MKKVRLFYKPTLIVQIGQGYKKQICGTQDAKPTGFFFVPKLYFCGRFEKKCF